jgi:hypothetical protein
MFREEVEEWLPMLCSTEDILQILRANFAIFEAPVRRILRICLLAFLSNECSNLFLQFSLFS